MHRACFWGILLLYYGIKTLTFVNSSNDLRLGVSEEEGRTVSSCCCYDDISQIGHNAVKALWLLLPPDQLHVSAVVNLAETTNQHQPLNDVSDVYYNLLE